MPKLLLSLLIPIVLAAAPALAHAILIDGAPVAAGTVPPGPLAVRLRFNSRIDAERSRLTLTAPGGKQSVLEQSPPDAPNLLEAKTSVVPGDWSLRWQVLAVDGHITRGDVPFTVAEPPSSAPRTAAKQ